MLDLRPLDAGDERLDVLALDIATLCLLRVVRVVPTRMIRVRTEEVAVIVRRCC